MIGPILNFDDLRSISRLGDRATLATVERWARQADIRYGYDGRGGIWTTVDAMNAAIGLTAAKDDRDAQMYDPDMVA